MPVPAKSRSNHGVTIRLFFQAFFMGLNRPADYDQPAW
jgi:hypothetical protein